MLSSNPMKRNKLILLIIIAALVGILMGFIWGLSFTLEKIAEKASKFVTIDPVLIAECVHRQGFS